MRLKRNVGSNRKLISYFNTEAWEVAASSFKVSRLNSGAETRVGAFFLGGGGVAGSKSGGSRACSLRGEWVKRHREQCGQMGFSMFREGKSHLPLSWPRAGMCARAQPLTFMNMHEWEHEDVPHCVNVYFGFRFLPVPLLCVIYRKNSTAPRCFPQI